MLCMKRDGNAVVYVGSHVSEVHAPFLTACERCSIPFTSMLKNSHAFSNISFCVVSLTDLPTSSYTSYLVPPSRRL